MDKKNRMLYGVISAKTAETEQRELLSGIIRKAQDMNIDIAVISNIYNPSETADALKAENGIYDLILSESFDGFIYLTESIINHDVQRQILELLQIQSHIPVVAVGMSAPEVTLPHFHFINTDDAADFEDITDHLIEHHGFTDIHILTGYKEYIASHQRVEGCKRSFQKHHIPFNENTVFYGNFWTNSGADLAKRYASGELPFPQALICCNDYMAYGFLDACMDMGMSIPDRMTVVGYEYIRERRNHLPLLTTYQRNRQALGEEAVRLLTEKVSGGEYGDFTPPRGKLILGESCGCGGDTSDVQQEIHEAQTKSVFEFLNLFSQLEHRLTECKNIDEFAACCWHFSFMIRQANKLYLCLYENWYDMKQTSDSMICYNLLFQEEPRHCRKHDITAVFWDDAAPYYFCPLFLSQREFGYVVLRFDHPDTYDPLFRNWLKTISNSLEFLRMKNDILYLTTCQNLSEQRDTLTGFYNDKGMKKAFEAADRTNLYAVMIKTNLHERTQKDVRKKAYAVRDTADIIKKICDDPELCGRIREDTFFFLHRSKHGASFWEEHFQALLCCESNKALGLGTDLFLCCVMPCDELSYSECKTLCGKEIEKKEQAIAKQKLSPHYAKIAKVRDTLYREPDKTFDSEYVYSLFDGSKGYFRQIYKNCFGITLHDDCTAARITLARYCLARERMTISEISERCGYHETKYFMRQFQQQTGLTAAQYRSMTK